MRGVVLAPDPQSSEVEISAAGNVPAQSREEHSVNNFVSALGVDTEKYRADVALLGCTEFVATINAVSISYAALDATRQQFKTLDVRRRRVSKLQDSLARIEHDMKELGALLQSVLDINIEPIVGLGILGQRIQAKDALITSLVRKLWTFNASIVDKKVGVWNEEESMPGCAARTR